MKLKNKLVGGKRLFETERSQRVTWLTFWSAYYYNMACFSLFASKHTAHTRLGSSLTLLHAQSRLFLVQHQGCFVFGVGWSNWAQVHLNKKVDLKGHFKALTRPSSLVWCVPVSSLYLQLFAHFSCA